MVNGRGEETDALRRYRYAELIDRFEETSMGLISRSLRARYALCALGVALLLGGTGCNVIGAAAQVLARPGDTDAAYKGLANQTVAVMVWVDRGPALDYPMLQSDIAKSMTINLRDISHPKN